MCWYYWIANWGIFKWPQLGDFQVATGAKDAILDIYDAMQEAIRANGEWGMAAGENRQSATRPASIRSPPIPAVATLRIREIEHE